MVYKGDQITWNSLSPSLKEKIDWSKYKEVPAKGALDYPSTYKEGLTVMRPTGEMAKTWYDITVKTPAFSNTRDIIVVLTNCVNGFVTEQYIQHKYYATAGTEKFEGLINSVWLRAANKRTEDITKPNLSWTAAMKTLPLPAPPSIPNPNAMWRKVTYSGDHEYDTARNRLATVAFDDVWKDIQPITYGQAPPSVFQDRTDSHTLDGRLGYDIIGIGVGYTYEAVIDLSFTDFASVVAAIRVDVFDDLQSARDLNYANSIYNKVYYAGYSGVYMNLPASAQGKNSFQFEVSLVGKTDKVTYLVISVCDATQYTNSLSLGEGSIVFKLSRRGTDYLI